MKISIITATYNSEKTLEFCMNSVLNQTYSDIEYVVVDGGSTDGTLDLIKSKAKDFSNIVWSSEPDKGIYDALNKGIAKATGAVVGFVHSDDYLANTECIAQIVQAFKTHQVEGVYSNLHYVSFKNPEKVIRNWVSQPFHPKLLKRGWMPAHPTLFLKKSIYDRFGHFNLDYKIAADYDFILRIFNNPNHKFYYLPQTIVKMRVGGASNKSLKNLIQKTKEDFKAAKTNHLSFPFGVVLMKNLSKIPQWLKK
ncbi:glycosyltransferase family 2 protein [Psychroserpens sp. SPM9]|uniref:glycosyltransferase family 2 protein n=1 Tax=Psychroserpens sp. SPM9 TaxID=2975598 RepID=UPI0021A3E3B0|nr:glycosyltransferase family 2 protein [Psychroserpens sp. SPM9]MDG5490126.1 glycosyltransferase family 2 protein [Psychroserpens sp. SPM9]